jgi:hypothetical protein
MLWYHLVATRPNAFCLDLLASIDYVINIDNLNLYELMHLKKEEQVMHPQDIILSF